MQGSSYRTNPRALAQLVGSIEKEYRELLDLRERVERAEAAAAERLKPSGKLAQCTRPVANGGVPASSHAQGLHQAPALRHAGEGGQEYRLTGGAVRI